MHGRRISKSLKLIPLVAAFVVAGCYHATVSTGRAPNGQTINKPWAMSFIGGLIPPATVETAQACPGGISKVETQHSFLNMLVAAITFSIVTPMQITVSCAGNTASVPRDAAQMSVDKSATLEQKQQAMERAADAAAKSGKPVYLSF